MKKIFLYLIMLVTFALGIAACQKDSVENQLVQTKANNSVAVQDRVPPTTGWASTTNYLNDLSSVQTTILALAAGYNGLSSGQSVDLGGVYKTDCADGDGVRIRNAIQDYHNWFVSPPAKNGCSNPVPPQSVITSMKNRLPTYNEADKTKLVNWIIVKYNTKRCADPYNTFAIPTTDNATLAFLGIRKQCLEWACTLGGTSIGYGGPYVNTQTSFRRGMGLYEYEYIQNQWKGKHAMIITDIFWTVTNGVTTATKFKVAESNFASTWSNPLGAIPWQRTVSVVRIVTFTGSPSMRVVNFG